eukprot:3938776-Rhodomonas_salina.8
MACRSLLLLSCAAVCSMAACNVPVTIAPHSWHAARKTSPLRSPSLLQNLALRGGGKSVVQVKSQEEFDGHIKGSGDKLVVVDFTATWCGPCQRIAPELENMAAEFGNVVFLKVDVDELQATAEACGIVCMPTFQFYKDGKKMKSIEGADESKLRSAVEQFSGAVPA